MLLKDVIEKFDKSLIKAGDGKEFGEYPLYTCSPIVNKFLDSYVIDDEAIVVSTGGNFSLHYVNGKFNFSTDCLVFKSSKFRTKYLFYYLLSQKSRINTMFRGAGIKHLNKHEFMNLNINEISINKQDEIIKKLDFLQKSINNRKEQLKDLEKLIKSQFIQMFDTNKNSIYNFDKLSNLTLKITDGKHGGCKSKTNSGYYFIGATEIYDDKVNYQTAKQITEDDFIKDYKRCDLKNNDFLIVNTGATIGKSAITNSELSNRTLLQKSVALIRVNPDMLNTRYLKYCYECNPEMYNKGNGCARINLLLSQIKDTMIPVPPLELQNKFSNMVEKIEKKRDFYKEDINDLEKLFEETLYKHFYGGN